MPRGANQKRKLLYLLDILARETDEEHPLTLEQIRTLLAAHGVEAERKSLYDDLEQLRLYGADIITRRDRQVRYYLGQRTFDLPELRLLVDAVQSSKFITHSKSVELIRKLEGLTSRHQAGQLQRQVLVTGRIKSMNESIYYNVDHLHTAMNTDRQVSFQYFDWDIRKQRQLRRNGVAYTVSPWALTWDDENYYLIAYEAGKGLRHYRVDRMLRITPTGDKRQGREQFEAEDMAAFSRKTFGMFHGEVQPVTLRCARWMTGVILDRFGQDTALLPDGDSHFTVRVPIAVSEPFFAWASGFGTDLTIVKPDAVRVQYTAYLKEIVQQYE